MPISETGQLTRNKALLGRRNSCFRKRPRPSVTEIPLFPEVPPTKKYATKPRLDPRRPTKGATWRFLPNCSKVYFSSRVGVNAGRVRAEFGRHRPDSVEAGRPRCGHHSNLTPGSTRRRMSGQARGVRPEANAAESGVRVSFKYFVGACAKITLHW